MEKKVRKRKLRDTIRNLEDSLKDMEGILMANNMVLGEILYQRYHDRMGFNEDGSFSRDGKVVWPERMVEE